VILPSAYSSSGAVFDVQAQSRLITSLAQVEGRPGSLMIDGVLESVTAARVTDELLALLEWDSRNLRFTNNDQANELLKIH
jgi:hypothetical protein